MLGILWDVRNDADCLRKALSLTLQKHLRVLKWHRVILTTTGTKHRVDMIPTRRLCRLDAAFETAARQNKPVHRASIPQGSKVVTRRMRAKINHKRKQSNVSSSPTAGGGSGGAQKGQTK